MITHNCIDDKIFMRDIKRSFVIKQMQIRNIKKITLEFNPIDSTMSIKIMQEHSIDGHYQYKIRRHKKNTTKIKKRSHSPEEFTTHKKLDTKSDQINIEENKENKLVEIEQNPKLDYINEQNTQDKTKELILNQGNNERPKCEEQYNVGEYASSEMDNNSFIEDDYCQELYGIIKHYQNVRYHNHEQPIQKVKTIIDKILAIFIECGFQY